ncbi:hypothetical protein ACXAUS_002083 [Clostridium sporogenes]
MNEYQRKVIQGRKEFLKLVQKQERELLEIYERASRYIIQRFAKSNPGGITSRYLNELDKSIDRYVLELRTNLSKSIKDSIEASSQIASAVQLSYLDAMVPMQDIKSTFDKMFTQLPSNITKQLINGNYYEDGKTLDKRIWNITKKNSKDIDTLIKINVAKGANARELAKELDKYINPYKRIEAKTLETGMSKNISYQAQRLSRTALAHANTETYVQGSKMNPFCRGLKWNLSPSHFTRMNGKTDICDTYAIQDIYDLGAGIYPPDKLPIGHPNCLCYPTQEVADINKARNELIDWITGESNPKLDKWIENYGEEFGIERSYPKIFNGLVASKEGNRGIIDNKKWLESNFSSEKKFNRHIEKHLNEYGTITEKEYLNIARNLLAEPLSKDVEGFISELGFVFKYKKSTNDFAIGRADGYISTLYKPIKGYDQWLEEIKKYKKED